MAPVPNTPPPPPPVPGTPLVARPVVHRPTLIDVEITAIRPNEVEVKLADGRPGVIEKSDLGDLAGDSSLEDGSMVEVALLTRSDASGRSLLSRRWALQHRAWDLIEEAVTTRESVRGRVTRQVKGGMAVHIDGLRCFLPTSMISERQSPHPEELLGEELDFLVMEADRQADSVVLSRRDLLRRDRRQAEKSTWSALVVGARVEGRVVSLSELGAQVELDGGVRGLIHRSELTWNRFRTPADVVSVSDDVTVEIIEVNRSKHRIGLSLRRLQTDPLEAVVLGLRTEAVVTRVVEYGCFVRLDESELEGLVHLSELTDRPNFRADQLVVPGERLAVKVIQVDTVKRRIGLSVRQALLAE